MNKESLNKLLDSLDEILRTEESMNEKWKAYCSIAFAGCYAPFFDLTESTGFLKAMEILDPELAKHLNYYVYELQGMETATGKVDGTTYNLKERDQFVAFVLAVATV